MELYKHTHTHACTDTYRHITHTRSEPSEKRMAQQSPGHNASLHPLISAERIERRRGKKKERWQGRELESERCSPQSEQREKTADKTREWK